MIHSMFAKIVALTFGLSPIFFLPLTQDFYATPKWIALVLAAALILLLGGIRIFRGAKPSRISVPGITWWFGALGVASTISLLFRSTNKIEAITNPLGPATYIAITILLLASHSMTNNAKMLLRWLLYVSASLLGIIAVYQAVGMGKLMLPGIGYLQDPLWTPTGAATSTIAILVIILTLFLSHIVQAIKKIYHNGSLELVVLGGIISLVGLGITLWQTVPKLSEQAMPFSVGVPTTLELLKNPLDALLGVGAENFVTAYTKSKPAWIAATPLWNVRFTAHADFFLHTTTVFGLLGLLCALMIAKTLIGRRKDPLFATRLAAVVSLLLVPPTIPVLTVVAAVAILARPTDAPERRMPSSPFIRYALAILSVLLSMTVMYFLGRFLVGEVYYMNALRASGRSDGTNAYNYHVRAIRTNTYLPRYHRTYSQLTLTLADTIASRAASLATDVDTASQAENDRKLASQLIEQSIAQAKTTVTLNPQSVSGWENLATIYQALIPVAKGADAWAESAYIKTISLDPTNPLLYINFSAVLVREQKYDDAISVLHKAVALRPTYPNAHYNLANVQKLNGDTEAAIESLTTVMGLVPADSADYYKAKTELEALGGGQPE